MKAVLQPLFIILLFVLVRAGDLAITSALAHSYIRAVGYGVVAILALIAVIIILLGLH